MKLLPLFLGTLCCVAQASGQEETIKPAELFRQAETFLHENVDDSVLDALGIDGERAGRFLRQLEEHFQGTYVYDLTALRETAVQILPLLRQYEETEPYAIWLATHFDYFEAAERLKRSAPSTPAASRPAPPSAEQQRKTWVTVVEERAIPEPAFPRIKPLKQIFVSERVPSELVWLAEVESSFNPKARSPVGAAGLFQLMPTTARSLDLSVGVLRDDRLHPEKNARAAAQYLRQLYSRFGDWRLALAAYNAGPTRVSDLLKKEKAKTFDQIAHRLPSETQMFVPKVEAIIKKREGRELASLKMPKA